VEYGEIVDVNNFMQTMNITCHLFKYKFSILNHQNIKPSIVQSFKHQSLHLEATGVQITKCIQFDHLLAFKIDG